MEARGETVRPGGWMRSLVGRLLVGGTEGNRRLTAATAAVLLVLLAAEGATLLAIRPLLSVHIFLGMLSIPPVALKLASTGYRFARYYLRDGAYRLEGPPGLLMRMLVAPFVVASTLGLFASGVALLVVGPGGGIVLGIHKAAFLVWFVALSAHVLAYVLRVPRLIRADFGDASRGSGVPLRRLVVVTALVAGATLAIATLPFARPWLQRSHREDIGALLLVRSSGARTAKSDRPVGHARRASTPARSPGTRRSPTQSPFRLVERRTGALPAPLQDAAVAALDDRRVALLGGLTAADASTDAILVASAPAARSRGRLSVALHDSAAVKLGRSVYLFGGGDGVRQLDTIVRVDLSRGGTANVGRLPSPSSDQAAAAIGDTAYVVGGYTGSRWLDTIVAWRPGSPPRVVAHLPSALRYAAVTTVGNVIVIAGGSLPDGTASAAVLEYVPATGCVKRIARLPASTTHAAAAALGDVAYVIGGRGATIGTPTDRVIGLDVRTGRIRPAGRLSTPRSDLAAVSLGRRIFLAGGRGRRGTESILSELVRKTARLHAPKQRVAVAPATLQGDVYAYDGANMLAPAARAALPRVYVPNSRSASVDVIDPRSYKVVEQFPVGSLPQHVTPAYDLKTLYVTNDLGNSLTPIDPRKGKPGNPIPVDDPYNLYFTPDGSYAIVVAERLRRLDFRDPHTFRLHRSLNVPCVGVDHMDFSADGRYLLASCEFSGQMIKVNVRRERVVGVLNLPDGRAGMPQDVKLSPDGEVFYVADMYADGLWEINGARFKVIGFIRTGAGVHGLYPSRDAKFLYASNRGEGSISVISFRTRKVVTKWRIPGGGSPDMGGVSADGKVLWLSGRYGGVVYAISTRDGRLLAKVPVGEGPHGLCVWPQPGRYSLGHTGILR